MHKLLLQGVVFVLVPSLVIDPVLATGLSQPPLLSVVSPESLSLALFNEQAFAARPAHHSVVGNPEPRILVQQVEAMGTLPLAMLETTAAAQQIITLRAERMQHPAGSPEWLRLSRQIRYIALNHVPVEDNRKLRHTEVLFQPVWSAIESALLHSPRNPREGIMISRLLNQQSWYIKRLVDEQADWFAHNHPSHREEIYQAFQELAWTALYALDQAYSDYLKEDLLYDVRPDLRDYLQVAFQKAFYAAHGQYDADRLAPMEKAPPQTAWGEILLECLSGGARLPRFLINPRVDPLISNYPQLVPLLQSQRSKELEALIIQTIAPEQEMSILFRGSIKQLLKDLRGAFFSNETRAREFIRNKVWEITQIAAREYRFALFPGVPHLVELTDAQIEELAQEMMRWTASLQNWLYKFKQMEPHQVGDAVDQLKHVEAALVQTQRIYNQGVYSKRHENGNTPYLTLPGTSRLPANPSESSHREASWHSAEHDQRGFSLTQVLMGIAALSVTGAVAGLWVDLPLIKETLLPWGSALGGLVLVVVAKINLDRMEKTSLAESSQDARHNLQIGWSYIHFLSAPTFFIIGAGLSGLILNYWGLAGESPIVDVVLLFLGFNGLRSMGSMFRAMSYQAPTKNVFFRDLTIEHLSAEQALNMPGMGDLDQGQRGRIRGIGNGYLFHLSPDLTGGRSWFVTDPRPAKFLFSQVLATVQDIVQVDGQGTILSNIHLVSGPKVSEALQSPDWIFANIHDRLKDPSRLRFIVPVGALTDDLNVKLGVRYLLWLIDAGPVDGAPEFHRLTPRITSGSSGNVNDLYPEPAPTDTSTPASQRKILSAA